MSRILGQATTTPVALDAMRQLPRGASVLIIDDSPAIRTALTQTLRTLGMFERIATAADGFAGYQALVEAAGGDSAFDVVLCDLNMPKCDGIGFLKLCAANMGLRSVPIIMLTGSTDQESKIHALELRASDYVNKAAAPAELAARVTVHLRVKNLHDALIRKSAELERLCRTDPLTGLANRRALRESLETELHRSIRYGRTVSFAMVDVDRFKVLNDTYGHQAGDHVLTRISTLLAQSVRKTDLVARYGGEEIAIMQPETGLHGAGLLAERMRHAIAEQPFEWEGETLRVSVSIGVASVGAQVASVEDLIRAADLALYRAKTGGRNRIVLAGTDADAIPVLAAS